MLSIVQPIHYWIGMSTLMKNDKTVLIGLLLSKGKNRLNWNVLVLRLILMKKLPSTDIYLVEGSVSKN